MQQASRMKTITMISYIRIFCGMAVLQGLFGSQFMKKQKDKRQHNQDYLRASGNLYMMIFHYSQIRQSLYMNHKEILYKLLKPSLISPQDWDINLAHPKKEDKFSAVSIILKKGLNTTPKSKKIEAILETQILLLERATDGKAYSGEVCLPGGKCDQGQNLFQTALRETTQQTGLQLSESQLIGIISTYFTAYSKPTHVLFTYAAVFYLQSSPQIKINPSEITNFRWLPVRYFMQDHIYKPIYICYQHFKIIPQVKALQSIKYFEWPAIDVGLRKNMYGLTLYILAFFISLLEDTLKKSIQRLLKIEEELQSTSQRREAVRALKEQLQIIQKYQVKIKELYFSSFQQIKVVWKEDCGLSKEQKQLYAALLTKVVRGEYPGRPRF